MRTVIQSFHLIAYKANTILKIFYGEIFLLSNPEKLFAPGKK